MVGGELHGDVGRDSVPGANVCAAGFVSETDQPFRVGHPGYGVGKLGCARKIRELDTLLGGRARRRMDQTRLSPSQAFVDLGSLCPIAAGENDEIRLTQALTE